MRQGLPRGTLMRHKDEAFDAIFTSDLKRAYHSAEIAFAGSRGGGINWKNYNESNHD